MKLTKCMLLASALCMQLQIVGAAENKLELFKVGYDSNLRVDNTTLHRYHIRLSTISRSPLLEQDALSTSSELNYTVGEFAGALNRNIGIVIDAGRIAYLSEMAAGALGVRDKRTLTDLSIFNRFDPTKHGMTIYIQSAGSSDLTVEPHLLSNKEIKLAVMKRLLDSGKPLPQIYAAITGCPKTNITEESIIGLHAPISVINNSLTLQHVGVFQKEDIKSKYFGSVLPGQKIETCSRADYNGNVELQTGQYFGNNAVSNFIGSYCYTGRRQYPVQDTAALGKAFNVIIGVTGVYGSEHDISEDDRNLYAYEELFHHEDQNRKIAANTFYLEHCKQ